METMFQYICETPEQCRDNIRHSKELTKEVVDLFCGAGGLTLGFEKQNFEIL